MLRLKILFGKKLILNKEFFDHLKAVDRAIDELVSHKTSVEPLDPLVLAIHQYLRALVKGMWRDEGERLPAIYVAKAEKYLEHAMHGGCIVDRGTLEGLIAALKQAVSADDVEKHGFNLGPTELLRKGRTETPP